MRSRARRWRSSTRQRDQPFFLYLTYNAVHSPLQGNRKSISTRVAGIGHPRRKLYASMLASLDDGIGKLMARLREKDLEENTLVFFSERQRRRPTALQHHRQPAVQRQEGRAAGRGHPCPLLRSLEGDTPRRESSIDSP